MPESTPRAINWQLWLAIVVFLFWSDAGEPLKEDLKPALGYWGSVAAVGIMGGVILLVICLLLRWGWRIGLAFGVMLPFALTTFAEVRKAMVPILHNLGAIAVAAVSAFLVALLTQMVMTWLLKLNWDYSARAEPSSSAASSSE